MKSEDFFSQFLKHFNKAKEVPFSLREKVQKELDCQEASGIIEKVKLSRWATPIVPILKRNGKIRLCRDYSATVNKVLQKVSYLLPTANENFSKLSECTHLGN